MYRLTILVVWIAVSIHSFSQNFRISFTAKGTVSSIDWVTATNLSTNQSVTFPGDEILVLTPNTGSNSGPVLIHRSLVFPNPFSGQTTFMTSFETPQMVSLKIQDPIGRVVVHTNVAVGAGENVFSLTLNAAGTYFVSLLSDKGTESHTIICTETNETENSIRCNGTIASQTRLKAISSRNVLGYSLGEIILFECTSGELKAVLTGSPSSSINYEVEFAKCTDEDGRNYSTMRIGDQIWMSENLAYLPAVSPDSTGSDTEKHYYVFGYEGTDVPSAKATANYSIYGVLYNMVAAQTACPSGWHLPGDDEWIILEQFLGMSESDVNKIDWRSSGTVGGQLKETGNAHWSGPNTGATNSSGFTGLPGGYRGKDGRFIFIDSTANFYSATENGTSFAWFRSMRNNGDDIYRSYLYRRFGLSVRCVKTEAAANTALTRRPCKQPVRMAGTCPLTMNGKRSKEINKMPDCQFLKQRIENPPVLL